MSFYKPEDLSANPLLPSSGTSVLRPVEPWEIPMCGRPCKITFRDESTMMGRFLSFSTDFEKLRDGIGQMPVALVELDNGEVKVVYAEQIQFMDRRWK